MKGTEKKTAYPTQERSIKTDPSNKQKTIPAQRPEEIKKTKTLIPAPFGDPQRNSLDKGQDKTTINQPDRRQDDEDVDDREQAEESSDTEEE